MHVYSGRMEGEGRGEGGGRRRKEGGEMRDEGEERKGGSRGINYYLVDIYTTHLAEGHNWEWLLIP